MPYNFRLDSNKKYIYGTQNLQTFRGGSNSKRLIPSNLKFWCWPVSGGGAAGGGRRVTQQVLTGT